VRDQDEDNVSAARLVPAGAMAARHREATHQADAPDMTLDTTGLRNQLHGLRVGVADAQPILNRYSMAGVSDIHRRSFPSHPGKPPGSKEAFRLILGPHLGRGRGPAHN